MSVFDSLFSDSQHTNPWVVMDIGDSSFSCGGYGVYITLTNGEKNCTSNIIPEFELGKTLIWKQNQLGKCEKFIKSMNSETNALLSVKTNYHDKFCPISVDIFLGNGIEFHYQMKDQWYSKNTNYELHKPRMSIDLTISHDEMNNSAK